MKKVYIRKARLDGAKHCFISKGSLARKYSTIYGREDKDLCLKVFDIKPIDNEADIYNVKWGDDPYVNPENPEDKQPKLNTTILEATQLQNIAHWAGLAPRVYALVTVSIGYKTYVAQLTDYVEGEAKTHDEAILIYDKVKEIAEKCGFKNEKPDCSNRDLVAGMLVDFQTFYSTDRYKEVIKEIYIEQGRYGKVYYQNEPAIGLTGAPRKSPDRIKTLCLDEIDFKNKKVLDIGCAGGYFLRHAIDKGAVSATGLDLEMPVQAAKHLCNYLGYFNIDFLVRDLRETPQVFSGDIAFLLSMNFHIEVPWWIRNFNMVVFEDNVAKDKRELGKPWTDWFSKIEFKGLATDHGNKPIYHLWK